MEPVASGSCWLKNSGDDLFNPESKQWRMPSRIWIYVQSSTVVGPPFVGEHQKLFNFFMQINGKFLHCIVPNSVREMTKNILPYVRDIRTGKQPSNAFFPSMFPIARMITFDETLAAGTTTQIRICTAVAALHGKHIFVYNAPKWCALAHHFALQNILHDTNDKMRFPTSFLVFVPFPVPFQCR